MSFDEVQFPVIYNFGARGGPEFETDIIEFDSGGEFRNSNRDDSVADWVVGHRIKTPEELAELRTFFRARKGRARGFRFKDWQDYQATNEGLLITGANTVQLRKTYANGGVSDEEVIVKPVALPAATFRRNAVNFVGFSLNLTTGVVTLTPDSTANVSSLAASITNVTQADPGVVTTGANHGFITGDPILHASVGGMVELNDALATITVLSPTTYQLGIDTTAFTAYTSGGTGTLQGAAQTNPAYLRIPSHGCSSNDSLYLHSLGGIVELNGLPYVVTVIDADRLTVPVDASAFTRYTSAGVAEKHIQPNETFDWTGEFDYAVRFDTDKFEAELTNAGIQSWDGIPIKQTRDFT